MAHLAPKLDPDFKKRVAVLVAMKAEADQSFKHAVLTFLDFCRDYFKLYKDAKTLGAKAYLHQQTGFDEPSVQSMYRRIGEQYPALKKNIKYLPPSQESLKELARAEHRKEGTIEKLVAKELLTSESSVSDVRATVRKLTPTRKQAKPKELPQSNSDHHKVTLIVSAPRKKLVAALLSLLNTSAEVTIRGDMPLYSDLKEALGSKHARLSFRD